MAGDFITAMRSAIAHWTGAARTVDFDIAAPSISVEAAARGLSWDMSEAEDSMVRLMHQDSDIAQIMRGERDPVRRDIVMPPVVEYAFIEAHPLVETPHALRGEFETLPKAMEAAERWALDGGIEQRQQFERDNPDRLTKEQEKQVRALNDPWAFFQKPEVDQLAEASEGYYARLSALAESRGADVDRDAGDRDFGLDL